MSVYPFHSKFIITIVPLLFNARCKEVVKDIGKPVFFPKSCGKRQEDIPGKVRTEKIGTYTLVRLTAGKTLDYNVVILRRTEKHEGKQAERRICNGIIE